MRNSNIRVGIIKPPNLDNFIRGSGYYFNNLCQSLGNNSKIDLTLLNFSPNPLYYLSFDLVHFAYFDPFFLTLPFFIPVKHVITVLDLIPIVFSEAYPRGIRGGLKWQVQKRLLLRANHLITISKHSQNDITRLLNISPKRITVTYLAADWQYQPITSQNELLRVKRKYHLPLNFLMYLGDVNYNKNLLNLITAFRLVKDKNPDFKLLLAGKSFLSKELKEVSQLKQHISNFGLEKEVIFPGFISDNDLPTFFNLARIYIQPSIYEGFGLPVVQAMACGTPVVCGKNSSLEEVGGEAAIYSKVTDPHDLAMKIIGVLEMNDSDYEKVSKESINQATKFSWNETAKKTFQVYQQVVGFER